MRPTLPQPGEHPSDSSEKAVLPRDGWSIRLLILALLGVSFFTLLPFQFNFHARLPHGRPAVLLGGWGKDSTGFAGFLNVLLFIPFGFAVSEAVRERGKSRAATLVWALTLGALLSYAVEFLQIYVPTRDSGWTDIFTNATGSLLGSLLFELCGVQLLEFLRAGETALGALTKWPRAVWAVSIYFALWIAFSVSLQQQTGLNNWFSDTLLFMGHDATGEFPDAWMGRLQSLQVWNRPVTPEVAKQLAAGRDTGASQPGLVAVFDFSGTAPYRDQRGLLPDLTWAGSIQPKSLPAASYPVGAALYGNSWLSSGVAAVGLVSALQKTNQLAIRIVCQPTAVTGISAAILSISQPSVADLGIAQSNGDVLFVLRSSLESDQPELWWVIRNVFVADRRADLIFSYDGSVASFYRDGKRSSNVYRLGPGAALARFVRHINRVELDGYSYVYYSLIFFTGGALLGIAARSIGRGNLAGCLFLGLGFVVPALALEFVLTSVSGRFIAPKFVIFSIVLAIGGCLWMNAEPRARRGARA
jgi:hypothetical protein